jgi:hypothetical protein
MMTEMTDRARAARKPRSDPTDPDGEKLIRDNRAKIADRRAREKAAKALVTFDNYGESSIFPTDFDIPKAAKRFRAQIRQLGVVRSEYNFTYYSDPWWYGQPADNLRRRELSFLALTQHAEMIFRLVQP